MAIEFYRPPAPATTIDDGMPKLALDWSQFEQGCIQIPGAEVMIPIIPGSRTQWYGNRTPGDRIGDMPPGTRFNLWIDDIESITAGSSERALRNVRGEPTPLPAAVTDPLFREAGSALRADLARGAIALHTTATAPNMGGPDAYTRVMRILSAERERLVRLLAHAPPNTIQHDINQQILGIDSEIGEATVMYCMNAQTGDGQIPPSPTVDAPATHHELQWGREEGIDALERILDKLRAL